MTKYSGTTAQKVLYVNVWTLLEQEYFYWLKMGSENYRQSLPLQNK